MPKKLSYEYIKKEFEKEGYKLLVTEYINSYRKLKYMCPKGHRHSISWSSFRRGHGCPYCVGQGKLTIKFIKAEFEKEGCRLLTKEYKNSKQKLEYVCSKGHKHNISWSNWKKGQRCSYCSGKAKKTIEFIKEEFRKEGYKLVSEIYINAKQKLEYICPNKHEHEITWSDWKSGKRCGICKKFSGNGQQHGCWRGGISCKPYCFEWSSKEFKCFIKERDGNKCLNPDCLGTSKKLSIHHIDYDKENCDLKNLITLCVSCNSRANKNREWHIAWYQAIMYRRYKI